MATGFKIVNKAGETVTLNELDKEAAELWGKEVHPTRYANPTPPFSNPDNLEGDELSHAKMKHEFNALNNWCDAIGWYIAKSRAIEYPDTMSWLNVMNAMVGNSLLKCFLPNYDDNKSLEMCHPLNFPTKTMEGLYGTLDYYRPYFNLISHWNDKGYVPKRVEL